MKLYPTNFAEWTVWFVAYFAAAIMEHGMVVFIPLCVMALVGMRHA